MDIVSLDNLIKISKLNADMVNSDFMSQDEWTIAINDGVRRYWNMVEQLTQDYYMKYYYFQTLPNVLAYDLPEDFFHVRGVDAAYFLASGSDFDDARNLWVALTTYMFTERNARNFLYYQAVTPPYFSKYKIEGDKIRFLPLTATTATTIRIAYTYRAPRLNDLTDNINVISGFDQYIAKLAAINAKQREESDVSILAAQVAQMESEIKQLANDRNRDTGPRVQDVYAKQYPIWGFGDY